MLYFKLFKRCFALILVLFSISCYAWWTPNGGWHGGGFHGGGFHGGYWGWNGGFHSGYMPSPLYRGEFQGFKITGMVGQEASVTNRTGVSHVALSSHSVAVNSTTTKLK